MSEPSTKPAAHSGVFFPPPLIYASDTPWPLFLLPVLLPIVDRLVIRREEQYLSATFGEPYARYMERVRRWL